MAFWLPNKQGRQTVTDKSEKLSDEDLDAVAGGLKYQMDNVFIKSWSTSGDADDRPTEEVAFHHAKIRNSD